MSNEDLYSDLITRVNAKSRFDQMDNLVERLTLKEYKEAIDSGLSYINSAPPVTAFGLTEVYAGGKYEILKTMTIYSTIRELCFTLSLDWLQSSEDSVTIAEFTVSSKFQQYSDMYDKIGSMLDAMLEKNKASLAGGCLS